MNLQDLFLNKAKLYTRCRELPMDVFIDCYCNSLFDRLVIKGKATKEQKEATWDELFTEYCDLVGSKKNLESAKELSYLECKFRTITLALYHLKRAYSAKCVEVIQSYGYRQKFDYNDSESYKKDIKAVEAGLGSVKIAIKLAQEEYKSQQQDGKKISEADFYELIAVLAKNNSTHYQASVLTVYEFAAYYKLFKKEIEINNKHNGS